MESLHWMNGGIPSRPLELALNQNGLLATDIRKFLCGNSTTFQGIFACNELPPKLENKKDFSIVVNLSPIEQNGTHWIAIIAKHNLIMYMDSFGLPIFNNYILQFIKNCKRKVVYNKQRIQSYQSVYCGYYTILFIMYYEKLHHFYLNFYHNEHDLILNDKLCIKYIQQLREINI